MTLKFISFILLVLLTSACIVIAAYDIVWQALTDGRNIITIIILAAAYLLMAIFASIIGFYRMIKARRLKAAIPRHPPIHQNQFPHLYIYDLVRLGWAKSAAVTALATPLDEQCIHGGWGAPGTDLEGVRFKSSILDTLVLLEKAVLSVAPGYAKQRDQSVRMFLMRLAEGGLVTRSLARVFSDGYESARYGHGAKAISQDNYVALIKVATVMLQELGYDPSVRGDASSVSFGGRPSTATTTTSLI